MQWMMPGRLCSRCSVGLYASGVFLGGGVSNEILDRRGLPAGGYAWNVEDDDEKTYVWKTVSGRSANGELPFIGKMRMVNNIRIWKI